MKDIEEIKPDYFIQKTSSGYRRVYPMQKDITKPLAKDNIHWKRTLIGSWSRLFMVIFLVGGLLWLSWAHEHDVKEYQEVLSDPKTFCEHFGFKQTSPLMPYQVDFNFSEVLGGETLRLP